MTKTSIENIRDHAASAGEGAVCGAGFNLSGVVFLLAAQTAASDATNWWQTALLGAFSLAAGAATTFAGVAPMLRTEADKTALAGTPSKPVTGTLAHIAASVAIGAAVSVPALERGVETIDAWAKFGEEAAAVQQIAPEEALAVPPLYVINSPA